MIFAGSGCTGAIAKLIGVLGLRVSSALDDAHHLTDHIPPAERPVVFLGPYEHHSNEIPWRESIADVVVDPPGHRRGSGPRRAAHPAGEVRRAAAQDRHLLGRVQRDRHPLRHRRDLDAPARARRAQLLGLRGRRAVHRHRDGRGRPRRAAVLQGRDLPLAAQVHRRPVDARACWWPAASCSPTGCPDVPGGGTVLYVNDDDHRYFADPTHREEGGTPAIIESIRAGMVFQLKQAVGTDTIREQEERHLSPSGRGVEGRAGDRAARQPGRAAALDRVVRGPVALGSLPAPQLRRGAAQRPLRRPVPRRLLVRRALRPPAARHRHRAVARVRARDHRRLRGDQAGLGARQLQLLRLRRGGRLHRRGGPPGGPRRLAAARRLPLRARDRALAAPRPAWSPRR